MEIIILTVLLTSALASVPWMIEYSERYRVIEWYEKSYIEGGIRYVVLPKPGMMTRVRYGIYTLKNGRLEFVRDV